MADEAMYEAKEKGKNRYALFDKKLHQRINEHNSLSTKLNNAFENDEFLVYFQPICNIQGEIVGAESLARWINNGEMISPAKFIPLLEQRGTIKEIIKQDCKKTAAGEMINHDIQGQFQDKTALVDFSMHPVYEDNKIVRLIAEGRLKEKPH